MPQLDVIISPMILSLEEVEHIAKLARLELTEEEKERFRSQLSEILEIARNLQNIDVSDVPPTASVLPIQTVLREDKPGQTLTHDELFQNAPDVKDNQFKFPPVLE